MKKWQKIATVIIALSLFLVTPLIALAQEDNTTATVRPIFKGALALVAPRVTLVDKEISLTVFSRVNQEPVAGAGIWALTKENAESLKKDIQNSRQNGNNLAEQDFEAMVNVSGSFLGRTNATGQLTHTFTNPENCILVAFLSGYFPGFSILSVRQVPQILGIAAPRQASTSESVTLNVFQRGNQDPINDAGIWAVTADNIESLKTAVAQFREDNKDNEQKADWTSFLNTHATSLGITHGNGQLKYTFVNAGKYLLITYKEGYRPGYSSIAIVAPRTNNQNTAQ